jgi:hypothetical protein
MNWSRDSAIGIADGYGMDGLGVGFRVPVGAKFFSSSSPPDEFFGPPNYIIYVGALTNFWLLLFPIFLFAAKPKEFFLDGLR